MKTTAYQQAFILHFGEMGSRWGINRTIGQIYALLYISPRPLNAEQITEALGISRSNTSMAMKELSAWQLVRVQHLPDDRRDYFTAPDDVWEIFRTLVAERRRREIEPTASMLRGALVAPPEQGDDAHAATKLAEMLELIELVTGWLDDVSDMDQRTATQLMKLGGGVQKLLGAGRRKKTQKATKNRA
ncbi:MAG: GbsR/MarR family transcriptional regulator [Pseudomonadota bacterium]